jgi:uncharacterized protein (TIGR03437 family)
MRRTLCLWILLSASWLRAQTPPGPELVLDVNAQSDAVAARGWPLLIRTVVISADGTPVSLALKSGAWTQALSLTVTDQSGVSQSWPAQLVQPASANLSLSGINTAEAIWLVAAADTASIAAGTYSLSVALDTTSTAGSGAWSGSVVSSGAAVTLEAEPASLSAEDEASKYLAFAAYARLKGDTQGAGLALDTLIAHQPSILEAYQEKADLLAAAGDYAGALALYQQTLTNFLAANPKAAEPLTALTRPIDAMYAKIAQQQASAGGKVTSVAPGRVDPAVAPDSIVNAYGSGLATGTVVASGSPTTTLGGTTVTITDSAGASAAAPIFFVSSTQVNYAAPASLALGAATVTVKAGDGTSHSGPVTVADVQPAVFVLNAAGLVAANIVRVTDAGQQIYENVYALDASNNIIAAPVDVSKDQVYLVLYATGIRRAPQSQVAVSIGGVSVSVKYAGAQGFYTGLDQVNVQLPASLAGRGDAAVVLSVGSNHANAARMTFK